MNVWALMAPRRLPGGLGWVLALGTACAGASGPRESRLEVPDSSALADTVEAVNRPISIRLVSLQGEAQAAVRITVSPSADFSRIAVFSTDLRYGGQVPAVTDRDGIATVLVANGYLAGPVWLRVVAPSHDLDDSVRLEVLPGHASGIGPADTSLYSGAPAQLKVIDRLGNARTDPVQVMVATPGIGTTGDGLVTAGPAPARAMLSVQYLGPDGPMVDTAWISVVPKGRLLGTDDGSGSVRVLQLDGSGYLRLFDELASHASGPAWRPDGTEVLFTGFLSYSLLRLHRAAPQEGATFSELIPFVTGSPLNMSAPEYTRDGRWVFFAATGPLETDPLRIWQADVGTGIATPLPRPQGALPFTLKLRPSPSPDGQRYAAVTDELNGSIRVFETATGNFAPWAVSGQRPRWHPVLPRIAFVAQGDGALFAMNDDGTGVQQLTPDSIEYSEHVLSWSPDGAWLLARHLTSGGGGFLELVGYPSGLRLPLRYLTSFTDGVLFDE